MPGVTPSEHYDIIISPSDELLHKRKTYDSLRPVPWRFFPQKNAQFSIGPYLSFGPYILYGPEYIHV